MSYIIFFPFFLFFCLSWNVNSLSLEKVSSRRRWLTTHTTAAAAALLTTTRVPSPVMAAPPIAVIAEELGYFPVRNKEGELLYVPKKIKRQSTDQAVELAKVLKEKGVNFYGAYWCPHCSRQKELFGAEAMSILNYVECSPKGYNYKGQCKNVDGYPSFRDKRGKISFDGERPLEYFAKQVGITSFDPNLEDEVPMIGTSCKLPNRN
jgi:hypothetical protein